MTHLPKVTRTGWMRRCASVALLAVALVGCSDPATESTPTTGSESTAASTPTSQPVAAPAPTGPRPAQPRLATDPAQLADDLVADEHALRDPATSDAALTEAARRQQAAYRALGVHPEWDTVARARIPESLLQVYDLNVNARRQLDALLKDEAVKDTLPAWRIAAPIPAEELLRYYREAEAASGVGWNYLAAVNLIETRLGSISGTSTAGAQGPMQFLPSTFAAYGDGGDIYSPRDSIMAAGRHLAANGFSTDPDHALYRYNNSNLYVQGVKDYAAVFAADPATFTGYHRWEVYYRTTAGDVLLPIGYSQTSPIPVHEYLAEHPQ